MNDTETHILVVEDDPEVRRLVVDLLVREGFRVSGAAQAMEMDRILGDAGCDLLVLDLMLPGEDGLSICRRLRHADAAMPILMLTAKSDEIDRVLGLEMGADDYLVKPFGPREFLARVRALLRRARTGIARSPVPENRFAFGTFIMDMDMRTLQTETGDPVALTGSEFDLLACFVKRPRRVLSRDALLDWVHGRNADPFDRSVDMLVSRLRKKMEAHGGNPALITTVRNGGYIFTVKDIRTMS